VAAVADISCPGVPGPVRNPINPSSLSSSFFLRPQILHATNAKAPRIIAPTTPTTTPMMVFFVFVDIPLEDDEPEGDNEPEAADFEAELVEVKDEENVLP
jgi:hypothetical protein